MGLINDKSNQRRGNNRKKNSSRPERASHSPTRRTGNSVRTNAYPSRNGLRSSAGVRRSGSQTEHRMRSAAQAEERKSAGSSSAFPSAPTAAPSPEIASAPTVASAPEAAVAPGAGQGANALRSSKGAEFGGKKEYEAPGLFEREFVTVDGAREDSAKNADRQAFAPGEETVYWTRSMSDASSKPEAENKPAEKARKAYTETTSVRSAVQVEEVPRETGHAPAKPPGGSPAVEKEEAGPGAKGFFARRKEANARKKAERTEKRAAKAEQNTVKSSAANAAEGGRPAPAGASTSPAAESKVPAGNRPLAENTIALDKSSLTGAGKASAAPAAGSKAAEEIDSALSRDTIVLDKSKFAGSSEAAGDKHSQAAPKPSENPGSTPADASVFGRTGRGDRSKSAGAAEKTTEKTGAGRAPEATADTEAAGRTALTGAARATVAAATAGTARAAAAAASSGRAAGSSGTRVNAERPDETPGVFHESDNQGLDEWFSGLEDFGINALFEELEKKKRQEAAEEEDDLFADDGDIPAFKAGIGAGRRRPEQAASGRTGAESGNRASGAASEMPAGTASAAGQIAADKKASDRIAGSASATGNAAGSGFAAGTDQKTGTDSAESAGKPSDQSSDHSSKKSGKKADDQSGRNPVEKQDEKTGEKSRRKHGGGKVPETDAEKEFQDEQARERAERREKRKRERLVAIGTYLVCLQAACGFFLSYRLFRLDVLPGKYFLAFIGILALLILIPALIIRFRHETASRKRLLTGIALSLILILVSIIGTYGVAKASDTLFSVSLNGEKGKEYTTAVIGVYVLADDPAESLSDANSYTFARQADVDEANMRKAIISLRNQLGKDIKIQKKESAGEMIQALYNGDVQAVILNTGYMDLLGESSEFFDFNEKTKLLGEIEVRSEASEQKRFSEENTITTEPFVVYLSGSDTREKTLTVGRSDVNILMIVNPKTKEVLLVNTPRDFYVPNPAARGAMDKLTHCASYGLDNTLKTLERLYSVDIDYYAQINFTGFERLVDALGGITVYSDVSFDSDGYTVEGYHFKKGKNQLDGKAALSFARDRHNQIDGDYGRGRHQMAVIEGILDKATSSRVILSNYTEIMNSLKGMFLTDLSSDSMAALIKMQLDDMAEWNTQSYPVIGTGGMAVTYSMPGTELSVAYPVRSSVNRARLLIDKVEDGETIKDSDINPSLSKEDAEKINREGSIFSDFVSTEGWISQSARTYTWLNVAVEEEEEAQKEQE